MRSSQHRDPPDLVLEITSSAELFPLPNPDIGQTLQELVADYKLSRDLPANTTNALRTGSHA